MADPGLVVADTASWVQWAIGGLSALGLALAGWINKAIDGLRESDKKDREEADKKFDGVWKAMGALELRLSQYYATKEELRDVIRTIREENQVMRQDQKEMRQHLEAMIAGAERRITSAFTGNGQRRGGNTDGQD